MSKRHKRRRRETDLENPVCPGCRSPQDLYEATDDPDSGLLECTFCNIRFFMEEIGDEEDKDDRGGSVDATRTGGSVPAASVGSEPLPSAPVLGDITDCTGANHG